MLFTTDVYITPAANKALNLEDAENGLKRHFNGDWGEVDKEDWQANEDALTQGSRLLSIYKDREGIKFWIITEADRSATTIMLPEEY